MARKRRGLHPEEEELWNRVAETARPLRPARKAALRVDDTLPTPPKSGTTAPIPTFRVGSAAPGRSTAHVIQPKLSERLAGQPLRMDHKTFGRMNRGKLKPEAKIDLHGMTLAEAHPALNRFLLGAHASGLRLVLVVTGKGRDRDEGGPIPAPRGALRHQLPLWLSQAPLRSVVLQLSEAHLRHGGSGAFYVYLRRTPGSIEPRR